MKRLYATCLLALLLTALATAAIKSTLETRRLRSDFQGRSEWIASSIEDSVLLNLRAGRFDRIEQVVKRLKKQRGHEISGLAVCINDTVRSSTEAFGFPKKEGWENLCRDTIEKRTSSASGKSYFIHPHAIERENGKASVTLLVAQEFSALRKLWFESFLQTAALTFLGGAGALLLVATLIRRWLHQYIKLFHKKITDILAGRRTSKATAVPAALAPLSEGIENLADKIRRLDRPNDGRGDEWGSVRKTMGDRKLVVIANREPYIHRRKPDGPVELQRPASGLVTALEPILRQSGGLWVAHGSGNADREMSDEAGELAVPPGNPKYTLKRIWLTPEEEEGYYYGFSNEGLWPLCHLAHTRPVFRLSDWQKYRLVNQRFCDSLPHTALDQKSLILVQDYHFALLPRMLKERSLGVTDAPKIALFWHIPWPNPEAFGICPWNKELLSGILGSDVVGFHTQYHCNNFLETCDRYLEARVDWEKFSVTMDNRETLVRAFPIGIDTAPVRTLNSIERDKLRVKYGIQTEFVAVGVDRIDYTKGLLERIESVDRFLEKYPEYVGRFTLVQMGSPSRTRIPSYQSLGEELLKAVERVNSKYPTPPIRFLDVHHEWDDIQYFYQLGDVCMVTSLHDGMNLVAKEYVWCQAPERGSLILSKFAGASRELTDAFIVNPYSIEEMADAIAAALALPVQERARRMRAMREKIRSHNAFHWAGEIIQTLVKECVVETPPAAPGLRGTSWSEARGSRPTSRASF